MNGYGTRLDCQHSVSCLCHFARSSTSLSLPTQLYLPLVSNLAVLRSFGSLIFPQYFPRNFFVGAFIKCTSATEKRHFYFAKKRVRRFKDVVPMRIGLFYVGFCGSIAQCFMKWRQCNNYNSLYKYIVLPKTRTKKVSRIAYTEKLLLFQCKLLHESLLGKPGFPPAVLPFIFTRQRSVKRRVWRRRSRSKAFINDADSLEIKYNNFSSVIFLLLLYCCSPLEVLNSQELTDSLVYKYKTD